MEDKLITFTKIKTKNSALFLAAKPNKFFVNDYINELIENDIKTIVVLMPAIDIITFYKYDLIDIYQESGFDVIYYPIEDYSIPTDFKSFDLLIMKIWNELKTKKVLIHCSAGMGRTGLVACAMAVKKGRSPKDAYNFMRNLHLGSVETKEQYDYLEDYSDYLNNRDSVYL